MNSTVEKYIAANHFGRFLGMDFTIIQPGHIEYRLPMKKDFLATETGVHGGLIAAFTDAILGVAALSAVADENKRVATIEFKLNFLKPVFENDILTGTGRVIQKGNRLVIAECEIRNQKNESVSKATGTFVSYVVES
ncbi:MAG: PaaI family thioesterase [Bacteroidota bacterium]